MENIFKSGKKHSVFHWEDLGDIKEGRGDLGEYMPVLVYRLMQYTMLDALSQGMGEDEANLYFKKAGYLAGREFTKNLLNTSLPLKEFVADLQQKLRELKICIFRIEQLDTDQGDLVVTAAQDLDCSGIPTTNETVCKYDEGFISGIFSSYFQKPYDVVEVDCWANGNRVCRFKGGPVKEGK
ncbi:MAG: 4-vinyl reductase [Deltaproteobacteria bacterium]|jgi:predicted hydrocarbon binding protein|nr:4-vinyl reductase [Deltaproteobacteria bacterium]